MALTYTQPPTEKELGSTAPDFSLPGVDGRNWSLADFSGRRALVVIFMCNHCPYVIAVQERINELAKEYGPRGVGLVGISPNDPIKYPADSLEAMRERAREQGYVFPYLIDETQEVARAFGAVCTPDPFVFENIGGRFLLRYHGRIDDSWKDPQKITRRELALALDALLEGHRPAAIQHPAMGCSIKWR